MSYDRDPYSRVNRYEKQRKNTKQISFFIAIGSLLIVGLAAFLIFGGNDGNDQPVDSALNENNENDINNNGTENQPQNSNTDDQQNNNETDEGSSNTDEQDTESEQEGANDSTNQENVEVTKSDPTGEDENVLAVYTGDWEPVPTILEDPYAFAWDSEAQDWKDLMKAVQIATGLAEDDMIEWLNNDGDKKMKATVSNLEQTENYRVYLSWVDGGAWQVTKIEELKINDKLNPTEETDSEEEPEEDTEKQETQNTTE